MSAPSLELPEPSSPEAVDPWIEARTRAFDPFAEVFEASVEHRLEHDCDTYPSREGPLLGLLARATGAKRLLDVGCGLGYSALWLAYGSAAGGSVDTIERDSGHAATARANFERAGHADRISIHEGEDLVVLGSLEGPYDLMFYDAYVPLPEHLEHFERLARAGTILATANLFLGRYVPELVGRDAAYREAVLASDGWATAFAGHLLLSVRLT